MLIDINKVIVNDRIRKDFGDIQELANDIQENGLINPPVVNTNYELLAGERRLKACKLLGWPQIEVRMMNTRDAEHELNIEISENDVRKGFTKTERVDYIKRLLRIEQAKAKEREQAGVKNPSQNSDEGRSDDATAKQFGISRDTMRREIAIVENRDLLDPADFADWDEGKLSTNKAFQRIKAAQQQAVRERDEAIKQRDKARKERGEARKEANEAEWDAAELRRKLGEMEEPQVIERTVEVVPEDVQRRIEELEYTDRRRSDDYQKLRRRNEELRKELDQAKVLLGEKDRTHNARWDIASITSATNQFIQRYGGHLWAFDQFYRVDEPTQQEFVKAMTNLAAFSQNILQMISEQNLETHNE